MQEGWLEREKKDENAHGRRGFDRGERRQKKRRNQTWYENPLEQTTKKFKYKSSIDHITKPKRFDLTWSIHPSHPKTNSIDGSVQSMIQFLVLITIVYVYAQEY